MKCQFFDFPKICSTNFPSVCKFSKIIKICSDRKDKSYFLLKGESFSIDYNDLIINTLEYPHPNNGIRFRVNASNVIIGGTLKEVDENGNELGDVTYFNDDYFYNKAIYHALSQEILL